MQFIMRFANIHVNKRRDCAALPSNSGNHFGKANRISSPVLVGPHWAQAIGQHQFLDEARADVREGRLIDHGREDHALRQARP